MERRRSGRAKRYRSRVNERDDAVPEPLGLVTYREGEALDAAEVAALFDDSGIRRPTHDLPRIAAMFAHANLVISARQGERLVGVARALTDFSYCCYLSDLAVARDLQRAGVGRELVRRVRERIGPQSMLLLLSAPEAMEYYPRLGFERVDNAFLVRRST